MRRKKTPISLEHNTYRRTQTILKQLKAKCQKMKLQLPEYTDLIKFLISNMTEMRHKKFIRWLEKERLNKKLNNYEEVII